MPDIGCTRARMDSKQGCARSSSADDCNESLVFFLDLPTCCECWPVTDPPSHGFGPAEYDNVARVDDCA